MAKIAVVTFCNTSDNYGQVLQYLATQEYLKERGHNSVLLLNMGVKKPLFKRAVLFFIRQIRRFCMPAKKKESDKNAICEQTDEKKIIFSQWAEVSSRLEKLYPRGFEQFRTKKFNVERRFINDFNGSDYDAFCVGSDQTWSYLSDWFFLSFLKKPIKKISIAPSLGHTKYDEKELNVISGWLRDFDFVTTREDSGIEMCKDAGYDNARKILDPTFLLDSDAYRGFSEKITADKNFILLYLLGAEVDLDLSRIYDFAEKNNLEVKYVPSQGRDDEYVKVYPGVGEWLSLMDKAEYVITNSFHGMAFSIIYRKKFMILPVVGIMAPMNERIFNLASIFDLEDRIYNGSLDKIFDEVDYNKTDIIVDDNKKVLNALMDKVNL